MSQPLRRRARPIVVESDEGDDASQQNSDPGSDSSETSGNDSLLDLEAEDASHAAPILQRRAETPTSTFHPFTRLPPELRRYIWELFFPGLHRKRVLHFSPCLSPSKAKNGGSAIQDGIFLAAQTEGQRRLLAVHKESRSIGLSAFPEELLMNGDYIVRYNSDFDIIYIDKPGQVMDTNLDWTPLANVTQIALEESWLESPQDTMAILEPCKSLRLFFTSLMAEVAEDMGLKGIIHWCTTATADRYFTQTFELEPGLGEDLGVLYCWPDTKRETRHSFPEPLFSDIAEDVKEKHGAETWPMLIFGYEKNPWDRFYALANGSEGNSSDDLVRSLTDSDDELLASPEADSESDAYESEGIDDSEILEVEQISEDEVNPDPISPGSIGFNDIDRTNSYIESRHGGFSSVEPELDANHAESSKPFYVSTKRRIVVDSDEEIDLAEPQAKRSRIGHAVVLSDSDEDSPAGNTQRRHPARRLPAAASNLSSDDIQDDRRVRGKRQGGGTSSHVVGSSDQERDQGESEMKPLSLAEKLRLHREANPIPISDDDGGGGGSSSDNDGESEEAVSDDDAGDEDENEDASELIDGVAAESDSEATTEASDEEW